MDSTIGINNTLSTGDSTGLTIMMLMMVILVPMVGIMMAITPYLMKKSECFAVTVPETALHDPYLRALKKRYLAIMLIVTALFTGVCVIGVIADNELATMVLFTAGLLLIIIIGYGLMLQNRSKVRVYKKEQNWVATQQEAVAVVAGEKTPGAISLKWNLVYLVVILLTFAIGSAGYAKMPDLVPMHMGFDGSVSYVEKTASLIWMPVLIQAFIGLVFLFSHWMIIRSKRQTNPNAPATSALAYGMFARAQSMYLLAIGVIISIALVTMPLAFMGAVTLMQAAIFIMVGAIVAVVGGIAIAVVYGQGGSRVFARMQASEVLLADDDRYWKLGIFYYNPQDPSLFLLERFGVGWTVNFARPAVWVIMVGFVVVTLGFIVAIIALS